MVHRTTILLDQKSRSAAQDLAHHYGCSTSEAIRRAVVNQRGAVLGPSDSRRRERVRTLKKLVELFDDVDPAAEVRRIKSEDEGF